MKRIHHHIIFYVWVTTTVVMVALPARAQTGRWPNGADVALSLTFDDGLQEHYTIVYPLLHNII